MTCQHNNNPCVICWVNHPTIKQTKILHELTKRPDIDYYVNKSKYKDKIYIYLRKKK